MLATLITLLCCVIVNKDETVDIEVIKRNAVAQHIALQEIAIVYAKLTDDERVCLQKSNLVKYENGDIVIATFPQSGIALFPEKIKGAHFLGAD